MPICCPSASPVYADTTPTLSTTDPARARRRANSLLARMESREDCSPCIRRKPARSPPCGASRVASTGRHALSLPRGYPERGAVAGCVQRATVVQRVAYQCSHGSGRCLKCAEVRERPDREERNVAKARVPTLPPGRLHGPKGGVPAAGDRGRAGGRVRSALSAARRRDWLLLIPRDGWSYSSERQRDRPRRYPGVLAARSLNAPLPVVSQSGR
jgi:hypothetical protein